MKENKYDDEIFFEKYSEMERSRKGLEGAGEWYELKKILPRFEGKKCWIWGADMGGIVNMRRNMARILSLGRIYPIKCWKLPDKETVTRE